MELDHWQGKTVAEIEQQMHYHASPKPVYKWIAAILIVALVALGAAAGYQQRQLKQLAVQGNALQVENKALQVENETLQQKVDELEQQSAQEMEVPEVFQGWPQNQYHVFYEVQPNDNLAQIAAHFYGQVEYAQQLAHANGLSLYSALRVGQVIKVPKDMAGHGG